MVVTCGQKYVPLAVKKLKRQLEGSCIVSRARFCSCACAMITPVMVSGAEACSDQAIQAIGWPPGRESASLLAGLACEQARWQAGWLARLSTASSPSDVRPDFLLNC